MMVLPKFRCNGARVTTITSQKEVCKSSLDNVTALFVSCIYIYILNMNINIYIYIYNNILSIYIYIHMVEPPLINLYPDAKPRWGRSRSCLRSPNRWGAEPRPYPPDDSYDSFRPGGNTKKEHRHPKFSSLVKTMSCQVYRYNSGIPIYFRWGKIEVWRQWGDKNQKDAGDENFSVLTSVTGCLWFLLLNLKRVVQ